MFDIFKVIGGVGILLISIGIVSKKRKKNLWIFKKIKSHNLYFLFGGLCLLIYSISIQDVLFIILQAIFILASVYDLTRK